MRKIFLLLAAIVFLGVGSYAFWYYQRYEKEPVPQAININDIIQKTDTGSLLTTHTGAVLKQDKIPASLNLKAVFFPQAPYGNWDLPWQEACEEASVMLVANVYLDKNWTIEQFNQEILKLVDWENKKFGDYKHTSVAQTSEILGQYFGLKTVIHENPTFEDVKNVLAQGHFIVMTFAGKELYNPFYRNGGPNYHAMMVKGYKENGKLIVHDVGTKRGDDYVYAWPVIENALHDYAEPIYKGAKRMIEVLPPNQ